MQNRLLFRYVRQGAFGPPTRLNNAMRSASPTSSPPLQDLLPSGPTIGLDACLPLLETLPDAMILSDAEGRIVFMSQKATRLFLRELDTMVGEPIEALLPDRLRKTPGLLLEYFLTAEGTLLWSEGREVIAARGNGSEFYAEVTLSPLKLTEGVHILAAVRDVTGRKSAEMAVAKHATEMEEFAAAVTHDLKAPLIGIEWLTDEALRQVRDAPSEVGAHSRSIGLLASIHDSITQMRTLIDGLLELAQLGSSVPADTLANVRFVAHEVKAALGPGNDKGRARIEVGTLDVETMAIAPAHLRQILHNLVANGLKFVDPKTGHVRIELMEASGSRGERLTWLVVDDNGPGVPAADRERVFRVFQRGRNVGISPGVGLGLSLVRKVAGAYGGHTWVEDSPLGGARFVVELPLSAPLPGARAALTRITAAVAEERRLRGNRGGRPGGDAHKRPAQ